MIGLFFSILMGLWPNTNPPQPKFINGIWITTMSDSTGIGGETGQIPPPPPPPPPPPRP